MSTVFIGGSRRVAHLPVEVRDWISEMIDKGSAILVGDAHGADKAVQEHLALSLYHRVTVYCSGNACRNNIGQWQTRHIKVPGGNRSFQFYAAKDREMARDAEFGLMIWDGRSPGTVLNVLRLVRASKKAILVNVPEKSTVTIETKDDWNNFLSRCTVDVRRSLKKRALPTEWLPPSPEQTQLELV